MTKPSEHRHNHGPRSISTVGPGNSVVVATGRQIAVQRNGVETFFEQDESITAIHAEENHVVYGTASGRVGVLDVAKGKTSILVRLPAKQPVAHLSSTRDRIMCVDRGGSLTIIARNGRFQPLRLPDDERVQQVTGARASNEFAVLGDNGGLTMFAAGDRPMRLASTALEFTPEQLAMSPDGYVIAAISAEATWIISTLDGAVLHRVGRSTPAARSTFAFFDGHTLLGMERTASGQHQVVTLV